MAIGGANKGYKCGHDIISHYRLNIVAVVYWLPQKSYLQKQVGDHFYMVLRVGAFSGDHIGISAIELSFCFLIVS